MWVYVERKKLCAQFTRYTAKTNNKNWKFRNQILITNLLSITKYTNFWFTTFHNFKLYTPCSMCWLHLVSIDGLNDKDSLCCVNGAINRIGELFNYTISNAIKFYASQPKYEESIIFMNFRTLFSILDPLFKKKEKCSKIIHILYEKRDTRHYWITVYSLFRLSVFWG